MEVTMRTSILTAIALMAFSAAGHAERRIGGSFEQITHDCRRDPVVEVASSLNQITLVGACTSVRVTGNLNQVTIERGVALVVAGDENQVRITATDSIHAPGGRNDIAYRRAITPKTEPRISSPGPHNVISKESD
jgi:hypothetical protein